VSLNHKRRIFRSEPGLLPHVTGRFPALAIWLAASGGVVTLLAAGWLSAGWSSAGLMSAGSSNAPPHTLARQHLSVSADRLEVIDGETLLVGDRLVRLRGIVAPARGSVCQTATAASADCGVMAANALASLVRGGSLDCAIDGYDESGRPVVDCRCAGVMMSEAMVREGWARTGGEYADLSQAEAEARAARRGIWRDPGAS
jgi:endonuclease YncB( thermonuclease family)